MHGDDSELILFVDPDEECLVIVVEDASSLGPVSLEECGLQVLVIALEEEVISGELFLLVGGEVAERVVLALELAGELGEGSDDLALDFLSLLSGHSRTERVLSEVAANSDTRRVDHLVLVLWETRAVQLGVVHIGHVLVLLRVTVVLVDDLVEEGSESVVGVVRSSVDTDAGVGPLGSGVDGLLEGESELVLGVLELLPNLGSKALGQEGLGASGEVRKVGNFLRALKVRPNQSASGASLSKL